LKTLHADCVIVGGGFGGVAAALSATDAGCRVIMTECYNWIGGQVTSQGLCALDELSAPCGEETGFGASYCRFKSLVREYYRTHHRLSEFGRQALYLNPGNALVSTLCAEPKAATWALEQMLAPALQKGLLEILQPYEPVAANRETGRITSVEVARVGAPSDRIELRGRFFLEATELGDLLPLAGIGFSQGAEAVSETGEPHALETADRDAVQGFTFCQIVEFSPGEDYRAAPPPDYEKYKKLAGFRLGGNNGKFMQMDLAWGEPQKTPFWAYRRLLDWQNFEDIANDVYVINVFCNDYHYGHLLHTDKAKNEETLREARELSRAYLHWLQTEAPRDDGGVGYPELKPRPDLSGAAHGLAQAPYIREGRRLRALHVVREQDIAWSEDAPIRADACPDSVGLGCYFIDLHVSNGHEGHWLRSRPYQIPLRSLVCPDCENLAVAGKNIGVTHITNGAYRLHPQEWAIGEAAGEFAAFCLEHALAAQAVCGSETRTRNFQRRLLRRGVPLYWYTDVNYRTPGFAAINLLAVAGYWPGSEEHLRFEPDYPVSNFTLPDAPAGDYAAACQRLLAQGVNVENTHRLLAWNKGARRSDAAHRLCQALDRHDSLAPLPR
jgi:hypothetical protein